jgi:hypothetical protein
MANADQPAKIPIGKLEAARRQIETAINLWFKDGDAVSIHTLVGAAHRVVHDMAEHQGSAAVFLDSKRLTEWGYDAKEFKKAIRKAETFFKHALNDPEETYALTEHETEYLLYSTIECYRRLVHDKSSLMSVFMAWLAFHNPAILSKPARDKFAHLLPAIQKLSRSEFFSEFSKFNFGF